MASLTLILLMCSVIPSAISIIAYDCQHPTLNVSSVSLVHTEPCNIPVSSIKTSNRRILVLQQTEVLPIHLYQCKVTYTRMIYYCGLGDHLVAQSRGFGTIVKPMTKDQCRTLIMTGNFEYAPGKIVTNIMPNTTTRYQVTLAGSVIGTDCEGGYYTEGNQEWSQVIVQAEYTISVREFYGSYRADSATVKFPSGMVCDYAKQTCSDIDAGHSFWDLQFSSTCNEKDFQVIYKGDAVKVEHTPGSYANEKHMPVTYNVADKSSIFTLRDIGTTRACMFTAIQTDYPRIVVIDITDSDIAYFNDPVDSNNANLFTFFNAKIGYVEHHLRNQITTMYHDLVLNQCLLEKQLLETHLSIANIAPQEFAYLRMKRPGFTSVVMGEVVYLLECAAVEVGVIQHQDCTAELAVNHSGTIKYMAPRTHVLQDHVTPLTCSISMAPGFFILGNWYSPHPTMHPIAEPGRITSITSHQWHWSDSGVMAMNGIYTADVMEKLRQQIMFANDKRAIAEGMTFDTIHQTRHNPDVSIEALIDSSKIEKMVSSTLDKVFGWFSWFGTVTSTMFGLWVFFKGTKFIIDSIINGYHLHGLFGFSWKMFALFWDTVTLCLIYQHHENNRTSQTPPASAPPTAQPLIKETEVHIEPPQPESPQLYPHLHPIQVSPQLPSARSHRDRQLDV